MTPPLLVQVGPKFNGKCPCMSEAADRREVNMTKEMAVIQPQVKEGQESPKVERDKEVFSSRVF